VKLASRSLAAQAEELADVTTAPALVRRDELALGEQQDDLVTQRLESGEQVRDDLALSRGASLDAVVHEALCEPALACICVSPVDRLRIEAANDFLVVLWRDAFTAGTAAA
jgi:hypothetical protein